MFILIWLICRFASRYEGNNEQDQEDEEQHFGNACSCSYNAAEAENGCDDRDNQKNNRPS